MSMASVILVLVTLERLAELALARRNTRHLLANGAREASPNHYPIIVALHAGWLCGLWMAAPGREPLGIWLAAFAVLQGLRIWVLMTLGPRWTTRIIVVPGEALVSRGPYRFLSHPNYVVVMGEIAILPLVFGLWEYAIVFSVLNASVLAIRIRAENAALASHRALPGQSA